MGVYYRRKCIARSLYIIALLFKVNFVFAQAPTISSFSPTTVCQGDEITITGTNFKDATSVTIDGKEVIKFDVVNSTTIKAIVSYQSGNGEIKVTTSNGTATSAASLSVKPAPQPKLVDKSSVDIPFTNCNGDAIYTLIVQNSSTPAGGECNYDIDWGDNTTHFTQKDWPAGSETSHTYTSQGYFVIKLTITPSNGCAKSTSYKFYNGTNPLASLTTTTPTTGLCAPAPITFQVGNWFNNSAGTSYQLDFGDGTTPVTLQHPLNSANTDQLVSHTYTKSSCPQIDFKATLKAINGCFTTTYTLDQIIVRIKPTVDFDHQPLPACIGEPVCFENKTIDGYSGTTCNTVTNYTWDFGDGIGTSSQENPCYSYTKPGTYTVKLSAGNTACGTDTKTKTVTVQAVSPSPTISSNPVTYCQGENAAPLTATGKGLLWYTDANGGTGSSTAPTPSTNNPGTFTYYVSQTLPDNCESPRVAVKVVVNALPPAPSVSSPLGLCKGQTANPLTATGSALLWYPSATGGTGSPTAPVPSTANTGTTTYYVSQTINGCEGPRAIIDVEISTFPEAPIVTSPVIYCQDEPAESLTATGSSLLWYTTASGGTGSPTAPKPLTSTPGNTIYYVSQSTGCGESPRSAITVTINPKPAASIAYPGTIYCNTENTTSNPNPPAAVKLTGSDGGIFSVTPSGLNINSSNGTIEPAGATPGTYTITYTIQGTNGCSDFTTSTQVSITASPNATLSYPLICSSDEVVQPSLNGTAGGIFSSTPGLVIDASTGAITASSSKPGDYIVTYTVTPSPPCSGFTTTAQVSITEAPSASISYNPSNLCNAKNDDSNPNPPVLVALSGTKGGKFSIYPATGLPIDLATGTLFPSEAMPGTYTISYIVESTGGCAEYKTSTTVTVFAKPMAMISYSNTSFCNSTNALQPVILSGDAGGIYSAETGLSINAETGAINPSLSKPGKYTITYTIESSPPCPGLITKTTVEITESPALSFPVSNQLICSGGTALFHPSSTVANSVYNWLVNGNLPEGVSGQISGTVSGSAATIPLSFTNTGTESQIVTVQVTPVNSTPGSVCSGSPYNLTVTVNPIPEAIVTDTTDFCMKTAASPLTVTASPGNTVNWYDENLNPLNNPPVVNTNSPDIFTYYVSQSNAEGCESPKSKQVTVVNPTAKIIRSGYTNPALCGVPSGSITLKVVDLNDNPISNIPVTVHYTKFQSEYEASAQVDENGTVLIPLVAGTYSDIYVETFGCVSQKIPDVFVLKDPTPPAQPIAGYNAPLCSGTDLVLTASSPTSSQTGDINYIWAGPAFGPYADTIKNTVVTFPSATLSYQGTYIVYAIQNNCISEANSFSVAIKQAPSKPQIVTRTPVCTGDNLTLQAYSSIPGGSELDYVWNGPAQGFPINSSYASINNVTVNDGGIYTITVTSSQTGCSVSTDTLVKIGGYPIVKFVDDSLTLPTGHLLKLATTIVNSSDPNILPIAKYEWMPSQDILCNDATCSLPMATIKNNVCYSVKATNIYGCSGSDTMCVTVFCKDAQVFLPNAFTPNGNIPANATFTVRASGIASVKSLRVFNRWGRIVFERNNFSPNDPSYGWDGKINGKPADAGVYVYTVEVVCENGISYSKHGNVTLIK